MLKNTRVQITIGVIAILFSCFAMATQNEKLLLNPMVQYFLGFISATMLVSGISALRHKKRYVGLFLVFIAVFLFGVILLNNTLTMKGIVPFITLYIIAAIPFVIFYTVSSFLKNKNQLSTIVEERKK